MHLDQIIEYLSRFGKPMLLRMDNGKWFCKVEMFTTGNGIEFNVQSSFGNLSPLAAAMECKQNLDEALSAIDKAQTKRTIEDEKVQIDH